MNMTWFDQSDITIQNAVVNGNCSNETDSFIYAPHQS